LKKKIHVSDVRVGMFIHDICGAWIDHPFWLGSFTLDSVEDLKKLKTCGIKQVWIDTDKGLDVKPCVPGPIQQEAGQPEIGYVALQALMDTPQKTGGTHIAVHEELNSARKILAKAKKHVERMFLEARMGKALQIDEAMTMVDEINQSIARNSNALLTLVRLKNKNDYTYLHSVAVCALMIALGKQLGVKGEQLLLLGTGGLFHDIGKAMIPETLLDKPGKLTDEEFAAMKQHSSLGWKILNQVPDIHDVVLDVVLHHHEKTDGAGYPDRLSGEALTLAARMGAVCDVYDAITSDRCYKNVWEPSDAIRKMASWQDGSYDLKVFHAFVKTVGIYPVGTLVKLKSGRVGVVIDQTENSLTTPIVKAFFSATSNMYIPPEIINLGNLHDSIESSEDPAKWGFNLQTLFQ
jgi:putative nucleotidyltransferase with HDIG domain